MHLWDSIEKYAHGILTDADEIWHTDIVPFLKSTFSAIWKADVAAVTPIVNNAVSSLEDALIAAAKSGSAHALVNTIGGIALQAAKDAERKLEGTSLSTGLAILASTMAKAASHPAVVAAQAAQTEAAAEAANPNTDTTSDGSSQGAADTHGSE